MSDPDDKGAGEKGSRARSTPPSVVPLPRFFRLRRALRRAPGRAGRAFLRLYLLALLLKGSGWLLEVTLPHSPQLRLAVVGLLATSVTWLTAWWWARQVLRSNEEFLPLMPLTRRQLVSHNLKRMAPSFLLIGFGGIGVLGGLLLAEVTGIRKTPAFLAGHLLACACFGSVALAEAAGGLWTRAFFAPRSIPGLVFFKAPGTGRWLLLLALLVAEGLGVYYGFRWFATVEPGGAGPVAEFLYLLFNPHGTLLRMHGGAEGTPFPWPVWSVFALVAAGALVSFRRSLGPDPSEAEQAGYEQWLELRPDMEIVMGTQPERLPLLETKDAGRPHASEDGRERENLPGTGPVISSVSPAGRRRPEVSPSCLQEAFRRIVYYEHQADRFVASYAESARGTEAAVVSGLIPNGGRVRPWGFRLLLPFLAALLAGLIVWRTAGQVPPWIAPVGGAVYSVALTVALLRPASAGARVFSALGGLPARWPVVAWTHHARAWRFLLTADLFCAAIVLTAYGAPSLTLGAVALTLLNLMRIAGYCSVWHRWLDFTGRKFLFFLWIIPAGVLGLLVAAGAIPISLVVEPRPEAAARTLKTVIQVQCSLVAIYLFCSLCLGFVQWLRDRWQIMAARPPQGGR